MKRIAIVYAIIHTLFLPESSIIIWREIGLSIYAIFLITSILGNVLVAIIFWRQAITKIIPPKILKKIKELTKLKKLITKKKTAIKNVLQKFNKIQKMSLWLLLFVMSSVVASFLPFNIILGLLLFAIFYLLFSYFLKGKEKNLSTGGYLGIIILNFIPIIPGPGQAAILIVAQKNTLKAKIAFFASKTMRSALEIIFYDQLIKLFANF